MDNVARNFDDAVRDGTNVRDNDGTPAPRKRKGSAFYGDAGIILGQGNAGNRFFEGPRAEGRGSNPHYGQDSGTRFSEQARDDIEHGDEGAGHKGNNVDIAQRYAESESDEYTEQAERMTRDLERGPGKHWGMFTDPDKRREYVEGLAELLRGKPARPMQPQEEEEKPFLSRKADDEFWASDEPKKQMPKRL